MNKRLLVAAALALATGSIAAGCGGGDDSNTTTAALSKDQFLTRGNQICSAGEKHILAAEDKLGENPSQAEVNKFATKTAIPTIQFEIAGLQALPPPSGDEAQVQSIISAAQQGLDKLKADPSLIAQGGQGNPFAEANKLAKQYGLTACAG